MASVGMVSFTMFHLSTGEEERSVVSSDPAKIEPSGTADGPGTSLSCAPSHVHLPGWDEIQGDHMSHMSHHCGKCGTPLPSSQEQHHKLEKKQENESPFSDAPHNQC